MDQTYNRLANDRGSTVLKVAAGQYLSAFDSARIAVILEGVVAVSCAAPSSRAPFFVVIGAGDCIALPPAKPANSNRRIRCRALAPVKAVLVPAASLARLAGEDAALAEKVLLKLGVLQVELLTRLAAAGGRSATQRVAEAVRYLGKKLGADCPFAPCSVISMSQADIARVAMQSRQTVNAVLRQLQAAGSVHLERGMVCVRDRAALDAIVEEARVVRRFEPARSCRLRSARGGVECYPLRHVKPAGERT